MATKKKTSRIPLAYTRSDHPPGMAHAGVPSQFKGSPGGKDGWKSTYHPVKPTRRRSRSAVHHHPAAPCAARRVSFMATKNDPRDNDSKREPVDDKAPVHTPVEPGAVVATRAASRAAGTRPRVSWQ